MNDPSTYERKQTQWTDAEEHFNEVVIVSLEICRIVGYCEDDSDVYYIIKLPNNQRHQRYMAFTGVGRPMWLKGHLPEKDYEYLDSILEMNGAPKEDEFVLGFPKIYKY